MVFQFNEYDDAHIGNSIFETGDWNGDGDFNSADLVLAFQANTYVANAMFVAAAIDSVFERVDRDISISKRRLTKSGDNHATFIQWKNVGGIL